MTFTAETFTCAHDNKFRIPEVKPEEELWAATQNLTKAITRNPGKRSFIGEKIDELKKLNTIFKERIKDICTNMPNRVEQESARYQEPRVNKNTTKNLENPPELIEEYETEPMHQTDGEWGKCLNQKTADLHKNQKLISRIQHRHNLRSNAALEQFKLDADVVMPVGHNTPIDTQGLSYKNLLKTPDKPMLQESLCHEIGRLAQGWKTTCGLNAMFAIKRSDTPKHKKITYGRLACDIRPSKKELYKRHRTRLTIGGNLIEFEGETETPTAEITTIKMLRNSMVSTPGAKHVTIDIKDMFLADNQIMDEFECLKISSTCLPQQLIDEHDLHDFIDKKGGDMLGSKETNVWTATSWSISQQSTS